MNAMVPGLQGAKMSSSDPSSKIDFLDPPETVRKKVKGAFCEEGNVADNGVLAFAKAVLIPVSELRLEQLANGAGEGAGQRPFSTPDAPAGTVFSIARDERWGGPLHYRSYEQLEAAFAAKDVHPGDLKKAVGDAIVQLLQPIQEAFQASEAWRTTAELAYPPEQKEVK